MDGCSNAISCIYGRNKFTYSSVQPNGWVRVHVRSESCMPAPNHVVVVRQTNTAGHIDAVASSGTALAKYVAHGRFQAVEDTNVRMFFRLLQITRISKSSTGRGTNAEHDV